MSAYLNDINKILIAPTDQVSVIIVTYNSGHVIESCLAPLEAIPNIFVVDNASSDDSLTRVKKIRPDARIIDNSQNHGYGTAVNQAFLRVETTYALLVNPDAVLNIEALSKLLQAMNDYPNAAIAAPYLYNPKSGLDIAGMGPHETNHGPFPVVPEGPFCTWFSTGAVWLCRVSVWREMGGFDENLFIYQEDIDFCRRLTLVGHSIVLVPEAKGMHLVSQASKPTLSIRWRKEWNIIWGHLYIKEKFENATIARREAWRLIGKHGPKVPFYLLVLDTKRVMRDMAITSGAVSYLLGRVPKRNL